MNSHRSDPMHRSDTVKDSLLDMTGAQLRAFLAVAEYGGFGFAARELNVSQPTISKAVKSLERKVGPLFDRSPGRAASLSPVGEIMKEEAVNVIQLLREIERKIELRTSGQPRIRVAVGEYLYNRCKDAVSRFSIENPALTIRLEMISSRAEAFRDLRLGSVDILLISTFGRTSQEPRIAAQAKMRVYRSPLKDSAESRRWIFPILDAQEAQEFVQALGQIGVKDVAHAMTVPNYYSIKSMCVAGRGQALLFEEDTQEDVAAGRLVQAVPGSVTISRGCHFYGESETLEKVARYLIDAIT